MMKHKQKAQDALDKAGNTMHSPEVRQANALIGIGFSLLYLADKLGGGK